MSRGGGDSGHKRFLSKPYRFTKNLNRTRRANQLRGQSQVGRVKHTLLQYSQSYYSIMRTFGLEKPVHFNFRLYQNILESSSPDARLDRLYWCAVSSWCCSPAMFRHSSLSVPMFRICCFLRLCHMRMLALRGANV